MAAPPSDPRILDTASFLAELGRAPRPAGGALLVADGGFAGPKAHARVGILSVDHGAPSLLVDAWLARASIEPLAAALARESPVRRGGWDAMYATAWQAAWTDDGPPLFAWDREGVMLEVGRSGIALRGAEAPRATEIAAVERYVSHDWVERGIRFRLRDGAHVRVAWQRDLMAAIDPCYDGLDLMADAAWTLELAGAIGRALGIETGDATR